MRILAVFLVILCLAGTGYALLDWHMEQSSAVILPVTPPAMHLIDMEGDYIIAAGVVEPSSEVLDLSFEVNGVIQTLLVEEGAEVKAAQLLATLRDSSARAQQDAAHAEEQVARAEYAKLLAGARRQERDEAWATVQQAKWVMDQALREAERRNALLKADHIAPEEADRAWKEYHVAREQHKEALMRFQLADDPYRTEDIRKAAFAQEAAEARTREAEAELAKTRLLAPRDGTVLTIFRRPGEAVSVLFDSPVIAMGDIRVLHVRAEVDEKDINQPLLGQLALVTAPAFGERRFPGKVIRTGHLMGKKNVLTGNPAEQQDRKVLEVIIELDSQPPLVSGLRVDVYIQRGSPSRSTR